MDQTFQMIETNGVRLRVAVAGVGPLVVLVHGWPESWYSWRHQIAGLSAAGYRVAALDVRGYGGSDKPHAIEAYDMAALTGDVIGVIDALGEDNAVVIGHDWGAPIAWYTAVLHPARVRAVAGLSVPHTGPGAQPFIDIARKVYQDRFFYQLYFQEPGVAEAELEADVRDALRKIYYWISGEGLASAVPVKKGANATLLEGLENPQTMPSWLSADDLDYLVSQFKASGFRGPLNRYRNWHRDWQYLSAQGDHMITQPSAFIAGTLEPVLSFVPGADLVATMKTKLADCRLVRMIEGAGHWVQEERPGEVNRALLEFLDGLDA